MKKILFITLLLVYAYGADIQVDSNVNTVLHNRAQPRSLVWTSTTVGYIFFIDSADDLHYRKTTDSGASWGTEVAVEGGTVTKFAIWYDQWTSGDSGTTIHITLVSASTEACEYYHLDTSDDTLTGGVRVFTGSTFPTSTTWNENGVSIVKTRGGSVFVGGWGDADGEFFFAKGNADPVTSFTAKAQLADGSPVDRIMFLTGNETDNDDFWCLYQDVSANALTLKVYDDSGNSWSESSTIDGVTESTAYFSFDAVDRHSDGHGILTLWNDNESATADLVVFDITDISTWAQKTDVITDDATYSSLNSTLLNQNNDDIYVVYGNATTSGAIRYVISNDGGTTWETSVKFNVTNDDHRSVFAGTSVGESGGRFMPVWYNNDLFDLMTNLDNSLEITVGTNMQINIGDAWKSIDGVQINIGDAWKTVY